VEFGGKMTDADRRRKRLWRLNQMLILVMLAALLGGLLLSQWQQVLVNAVLL
jgi:hypothetical protein